MWLGLPRPLLCHRVLQGDVPIRVAPIPVRGPLSQLEVSSVWGVPIRVQAILIANVQGLLGSEVHDHIPLYKAAAAVRVDLLM